FFQTDGVDLADDNGNMYLFWHNEDGTYGTPDLLAGQATLVANVDGTYTLTYKDASSTDFNSGGLMTSHTDALGNKTSYTYNTDGSVATMTDPSNHTTTYAYTSGLLTSVTDFAGRVTSYTYDGNQLASITQPAPGDGEATPETTFTYDSTNGLLKTITDASGTKTLSYDQWRAVTKIQNPDGT